MATEDPFAAVRAKAANDTTAGAPEDDPFASVRSQKTTLMRTESGEVKNVPKNLQGHYQKFGFASLPAAGAIAGSFMGGGAITKALGIPVNPVAAAGAALGSAGGEGLRQLGSGIADLATGQDISAPQTPGALLAEQGKAALAGGLSQLGGDAAAKGLGWIGKKFGQAALKASPEVVQTAITEGISASQRGLVRATNKILSLGAEARQIAAQATRGGVKLDIQTGVAQPVLNKLGQEIYDSGVSVEERLKALETIVGRVMRDNKGQSTPTKVLAFRKGADSEAQAIYRAQARGQFVPPTQLEEARIWKELADHARDFMNNLPGQFKGKSGTMADVNARTSALIEARNAVQKVAKPGRDFSERAGAALAARGTGAAIGGTWGLLGGEGKLPGGPIVRMAEGAALGGALSSPGLLMRLARATNSKALEKGIPAVFQTGTAAVRESGRKPNGQKQ